MLLFIHSIHAHAVILSFYKQARHEYKPTQFSYFGCAIHYIYDYFYLCSFIVMSKKKFKRAQYFYLNIYFKK